MAIISKYIYSNKVAEARDLETLSVDSLMGVDYSSSMLNITDYHAYDMTNFLKKNNVLQKRNGFKSVGKGKVNGLWKIHLRNNNIDIDFYILHIGTSLYACETKTKLDIFTTNSDHLVKIVESSSSTPITDAKSSLWFADDRIYILCGSYYVIKFFATSDSVSGGHTTINLDSGYVEDDGEEDSENDGVIKCNLGMLAMYGTKLYKLVSYYETPTHISGVPDSTKWNTVKSNWEDTGFSTYIDLSSTDIFYKIAKVVDDEDTYIPTTTIGITSPSSEVSISRTTLDDPNMLSHYRYNKINTTMGSGVTTSDDSYYKFILDGVVKTTELDKTVVTLSTLINGSIVTLSETLNSSASGTNCHYATNSTNHFKIVTLTDSSGNALETYLEIRGGLLENPTEESDNCIVKFYVDSTDSDAINGCTFGVLFGQDNNKNRLFLTGNKNFPNIDYHSSRRNIYASDNDNDLSDSQDYTYFSVYDTCQYGTSNTSITGYQVMGDGSLAIFKEDSQYEPTIYFLTPYYSEKEMEVNGETVSYTVEAYKREVGNVGQGTVSFSKGYSLTANMNNDIILPTPNGIFGMASTITASSLNSDYKSAYARSRLINSKLKDYITSATNIATILYNDKFYITTYDSTNGYHTFVGDGRYPYKLADSIDNEYEYEWFPLSNIKALNYFIVDNELYFSNGNGLYKFIEGNYIDNVNTAVTTSQCLLTYRSNTLSYITFDSDLVSAVDMSNVVMRYNTSTYIAFNDTITISYENNVTTIDISSLTNKEAIAKYLNDETNTLLLVENSTSRKEIASITFVDNEQYKYQVVFENDAHFDDETEVTLLAAPKDDSTISFKFKETATVNGVEVSRWIPIDIYGNEIKRLCVSTLTNTTQLSGYLESNTPVSCSYLTKAYNCGQSLYTKVLRSLTIVNDSELLSYCNFGIRTKKVAKRFDSYAITSGTSAENIYENIFRADLNANKFATSFTKNYLLKFNFIQFEFYNTDDSNCVINNLSMVYTYGFKKKGAS